jgi:hypothetical protein
MEWTTGSANEMWNSLPRLFFGGTGFPACAGAGYGAYSAFLGFRRRNGEWSLPLPISKVLSGAKLESP